MKSLLYILFLVLIFLNQCQFSEKKAKIIEENTTEGSIVYNFDGDTIPDDAFYGSLDYSNTPYNEWLYIILNKKDTFKLDVYIDKTYYYMENDPCYEESSPYYDIQIKDFDGDGKDELFAKIYSDNNFNELEDVPKRLATYGITTNFMIIEYENDSLIYWSFPQSLSVEQYFYSLKFPKYQQLKPKSKKGKYGYVNKKNDWVIFPVLDTAYSFHKNVAIVKHNDCWLLINQQGKIVTNFDNSNCDNIFFEQDNFDENDLLLTFNRRTFRFFNIKGKTPKENAFIDAYPFSEGLARAANKDYQFGFIDTTMNWIIKPQFHIWETSNFKNGKAWVRKSEQNYYLYKNGKLEKTDNKK